MRTTFGIEEEFMLLDPATLTPVDCAAEVVAALDDGQNVGRVTGEFLRSQVEYATPVCTTMVDAYDALLSFRHQLGKWAISAGVVAAGSGTPFRNDMDPATSPGARYDRIASVVTALAGDHQINSLHVHIGVDPASGIRASNALRGWLPVLLALSGNSPFWHGRDTGYDSWRAIHSRRWTTYGVPPVFRDVDDYDRTVAALIGIGATVDAPTLNWNIRLSTRYPTLEVRVCDAQLDAGASVALAVIIRALVDASAAASSVPVDDLAPWDAALWHAARYGVSDTLVHPLTGRLAPAQDVLTALHDRISPHLSDSGEERAVTTMLDRSQTGATLQRDAFRVSLSALADLYRERLAQGPRR